GAQGICFSVASNTALHVLTQILQHGRVRRARIGVIGEQMLLPRRVQDMTGLKQPSAVRVREVQSGSPAADAGIRAGDVLVRIDGEAVTGIDDVARILDGRSIGRKVTAAVLRTGELVEAAMVPVERGPGD